MLDEQAVEKLSSQSEKQLVKRKCRNINLSLLQSIPCIYTSAVFEFKSESYSEYIDELFYLLEFGAVAEFILNKNKFKGKDVLNPWGESFMHIAARRGEWLIVKYFVEESDLSIVSEDFHYDTPVFHVVRQDRNDLFILMLFSGLDVEYKNGMNVSLLHVAAESGASRITHYLLRRNVEVNCKDGEGFTAFHNALGQDQIKLIYQLLNCQCLQLDLVDNDQNNYLHHAVRNDHQEIAVALLLRRPVLLKGKNIYGKTPKDTAVDLGNEGIVKLLSGAAPLQLLCIIRLRSVVLANPGIASRLPALVKSHFASKKKSLANDFTENILLGRVTIVLMVTLSCLCDVCFI
ncbi:ankyrin repeat domain-containing protein [Kistimonas asteriae]|uniref:ankyrin repeat domain-containing protein n=1 Tax=Kistimonas asteriae TaxID=517724 RepID=UPI001BA49F35|nr:ankyrin repeat domain-containing protein [Kistimonas asteriae]